MILQISTSLPLTDIPTGIYTLIYPRGGIA
jgi:hypothetical protein